MTVQDLKQLRNFIWSYRFSIVLLIDLSSGHCTKNWIPPWSIQISNDKFASVWCLISVRFHLANKTLIVVVKGISWRRGIAFELSDTLKVWKSRGGSHLLEWRSSGLQHDALNWPPCAAVTAHYPHASMPEQTHPTHTPNSSSFPTA